MWNDCFCTKKKKRRMRMPLNKNYALEFYDVLFLPFLIFFCCIEPWNICTVLQYFKYKKYQDKTTYFRDLFCMFIYDVITFCLTILMLCCITTTYSCLMLIIRTLNKNILKRDSDSIAEYEANYKYNYRIEIRLLYYKNLKKVFNVLFFFMDFLLITRTTHLFKRTKPFLKAFFINIKLSICNLVEKLLFFILRGGASRDLVIERLNKRKLVNLHHLPPIVLISICNYLDVNSISNLAMTSRSLAVKTRSNILWKQIYEGYYRKKLRKTIHKEQFILFNPERYDNYKEACHQVSNIIFEKDILKGNEMRDRIIGFYRVVEEETLESIIRVPNLLLVFPWKIIGYTLYQVNKWIDCTANYIKDTNIVRHYLVVPIKHSFFELSKYSSFNNIQVISLFGMINLVMYIVKGIAMILINIFILFIKIICFAHLRIDENVHFANLRHKMRNLSKKSIFFQSIYLGFYIIFHNFISILPTFYYLYSINDKIQLNLFPLSFITICQNLSKLVLFFWNSRLLVKFQMMFGRYGLNLLFYYINFETVRYMDKMLSQTEIIIYNIIFNILKKDPFLLYIINTFYPFNCFLLYFNCLIRLIPSEYSFLIKILQKFFTFTILIPFILWFYNYNYFFLSFLILIYGIINCMLIGMMNNRDYLDN